MARELSRIQQGFFRTQDRVVQTLAKLLTLNWNGAGKISIVDAGCGEGKALADLKDAWRQADPKIDDKLQLLGIESDKRRVQTAADKLDAALWASIEDAHPSAPVSLLWFNPPYDRIRGGGRLELELFNRVKGWPAPGTGLLIFIAPDYVLRDQENFLPETIDSEYDVLKVFRYPEPEYDDFKQAVLIGRRRAKPVKRNAWSDFPKWATESWPILPDAPKTQYHLHPTPAVTLKRAEVGAEIMLDVISRSSLRHALLRDASAPEPPIARPLLPLRHGHLALALAGGLCDGIIEEDGVRFLIKGTLQTTTTKRGTKEKLNADGEVVAMVDIYRTNHEMFVRCLREDGSLETYSSAEPEVAEATVDGAPAESEEE